MCEVDTVIAEALRSSALLALDGSVRDTIKLSIMIGHVEYCITQKTGAKCPSIDEVQAVCDEGMTLIEDFAKEVQTAILASGRTDARPILKLIISRLASSVSASLPADPKHKQHLSRLAIWLQSGKKRKGLQMDCAGLTLAVYCTCQLLQDSQPSLADVRMSVAEDHCWISVDGSPARSSAAEVAAASAALQAEPPATAAWGTWLYCAGAASVCTPQQVVAAVITSMDTCVGERATNESDPARALQRRLLAALAQRAPAALYPNAACVLAELQQDDVLDAARDAAAAGEDAVPLLRRLQGPYEAMRKAAGACAPGVSGGTRIDCRLTVGRVAALLPAEGNCCWYPFWFLASFLTDTAETLVDNFATYLGSDAVAQEVHNLCMHALQIMAGSPLHKYRYSKDDGQLHKALEHVMEVLVTYFQYQDKHACVAETQEACFAHFLQFVDHIAVYFSSVGIGGKLCKDITKITKMQPQAIRCKVAHAYSFAAVNLQGSASLWDTAAPSLRVVLEATSKDGGSTAANAENGENRLNGRRTRARTQVDM